jgi:hypothetical protein
LKVGKAPFYFPGIATSPAAYPTSMLLRLSVLTFLLTLRIVAQQGDDKGVRMDPVVPKKLIPPSPVLPVEEALKSFQLAPGFVIEAVAAEPLVEKPVCLDVGL